LTTSSSPSSPSSAASLHDVVIIGGSYAGLSAALQVARTGRSVLLLDAGERRNRMVAEAHGYLGFDGVSPAEIAERGRRDVLAYPNVTWKAAFVSEARKVTEPDGEHFLVKTADDSFRGKRLILATGVRDQAPALPGVAEGWGRSIFQCPYCHGREAAAGPRGVGVIAAGELSVHHASLVADWSPRGKTTFFLADSFVPTEEQLADLARRGIVVEHGPLARVAEDPVRVYKADGKVFEFNGLFMVSQTRLSVPFAEQLGCELEVGPLGPSYKTGLTKETTVPGVFACGDNCTMAHSVTGAVYTGMMAGVGAHQSLVFRP
jgi:thioredoxin reductase